MTAKLLQIKGYVRRAPARPRAYLEKHAELRREVDELRIDHMGELLADALLLSLADEEAC